MAWLSRLPKRRIVSGLDLDEDDTPAAPDQVHQTDSRSANEEVGTLGTPEQKRKRLRKGRIVEDKENIMEPERQRQSDGCSQPSLAEDCEPKRPAPLEPTTPRRRRRSGSAPSTCQEGSFTVAERQELQEPSDEVAPTPRRRLRQSTSEEENLMPPRPETVDVEEATQRGASRRRRRQSVSEPSNSQEGSLTVTEREELQVPSEEENLTAPDRPETVDVEEPTPRRAARRRRRRSISEPLNPQENLISLERPETVDIEERTPRSAPRRRRRRSVGPSNSQEEGMRPRRLSARELREPDDFPAANLLRRAQEVDYDQILRDRSAPLPAWVVETQAMMREYLRPYFRAEVSLAVASDPIEIPDTPEDRRELERRERSRRQTVRSDRAFAQRLQFEEEREARRARNERIRQRFDSLWAREAHAAMASRSRLQGREFTGDDYEALLQLDDATENRHDPEEVQRLISMLPSSKLTAGASSPDCSICMDQMEVGQTVKTLPCMHAFHSDCIDRWLLQSKKGPRCPIDQEDVKLETRAF